MQIVNTFTVVESAQTVQLGEPGNAPTERPPTMSPTFTEDELVAAASSSTLPPDDSGPFAGYETEHIYIGDESQDPDNSPRTVSKRVRIKNFARGVASELTFYAEGFLNIREGTRKKLTKDHTLELRFVDPDPAIDRRIASGWLWVTLGFAVLALAGRFLLPITELSDYALAITVLLATLAAVAFLSFIYKSEERIRFYTASGRAEVLSLVSSFGCVRKVRRTARAIQASINGAGIGAYDVRYLRAEMQAHYRLRENGVITAQACADGTALILSKFG